MVILFVIIIMEKAIINSYLKVGVLLVAMLLTSIHFSIAQQKYYVDIDASGNNDGSDWLNAFTELESALAIASTSVVDTILVAEGTYYPTREIGGGTSHDRLKAFQIVGDVALMGGFQGTETYTHEADPTNNRTILSGDIGNPGDNTDNCFHVIYSTTLSQKSLLFGLTISDGNADGNFPHYNGGGLYISSSANNSSLKLSQVIIENNYADDYGGGLYIRSTNGNVSPTFNHCVLANNYADYRGGGAYIYSQNATTSPEFYNCIFSENGAKNIGGGVFIRTAAGFASISFINSTLLNNNTNSVGDLIYYSNSGSTPGIISFRNSIVWGNGSQPGNQVTIPNGILEVNHSLFNYTVSGTGNINPSDPGFIDFDDPDGPDDVWMTPDDGYLYSFDSPGFNAGSNTAISGKDLLGNNRIQDGVVDMGAYEVFNFPKRLYVDIDANGNNDGTDWTNAFTDLESALAIASTEFTDTVLVAEGTYYPTQQIGGGTGNPRLKSFVVRGEVVLMGGFNGTETSKLQSDPINNVTHLSGDIGNVDDNSDNCFHVMFANNMTDKSLIYGLTISNGNADGSFPHDRGAGISNRVTNNPASPTYSNLIIKDNISVYRGGGIYNYSENHESNPTIENSVFHNNKAGFAGGGLYVYSYYDNAFPQMFNLVFEGNVSETGGGGLGIRSENGKSSASLTNCTFLNNSATVEGGAIFNYSFLTNDLGDLILKNSILWNNGGSLSEEVRLNNSNFSATYNLAPFAVVGEGNISTTNPGFFDISDADGSDNAWRTEDDGLQLVYTSPALNTGDETGVSAKDVLNNDRIKGGHVDRGAYEQPCPISDQPIPTLKDTICFGSSLQITLSNSQNGVSYSVYNPEGEKVSDQVNGSTGQAITLSTSDTITRIGNYAIRAEHAVDNCSLDLSSKVTLSFKFESDSTWNVDVCDSYTWSQNGETYTQSTSVKDTIPNAVGCDSVATLNLVIRHKTDSIWNEDVCDSYLWSQNGKTYTQSTTVKDTVVNAAGCDSIATLNLIIRHKTDSVWNVDVCDTYTWPQNGETYTQNITIKDTVVNAAGCDSIATLNLTVRHRTDSIWNVDACDSYTWPQNGETYTQNTTVKDTVVNAAGCDSIAILNLNIRNTTYGTDVQDHCDSYTWINGVTYYTSTNFPQFTLTNAAGCDSVVNLNLTIRNSTHRTDAIVSCDSYTWINGKNYTSSNNTDSVVYTNAVGCDSIVYLDLTINYTTYATQNRTGCNSFTWINGKTYVSNIYNEQFVTYNSKGCDSVIILNLTLDKTYSKEYIEACESHTWRDGITYTSSVYGPTDTLTNHLGCDSIIILDLNITGNEYTSSTIMACDSFVDALNQVHYSSFTLQVDSSTNALGCDSIHTTYVQVNATQNSVQSITVCDSLTWIDGNNYFTSTNSPTITLTSSTGCDSIISLNLTVIGVPEHVHSVTQCNPFVWVNGKTYFETAVDTLFLSTEAGCDSLLILDYERPISESIDTIVSCDSITWINGFTYYDDNQIAGVKLENQFGCDSTVYLDLTILSSYFEEDNISTCEESYTWIDGNTYYQSTFQQLTYVGENGCDSIHTLNLSLGEVSNTELTQQESYLVAANDQAEYQWVDCDSNFAPISGENQASFYPESNGNYAVVLNEFGCVDTSVCIPFIMDGIEENNLGYVNVFPNPSSGEVYISTSGSAVSNCIVYTTLGQEIQQFRVAPKQTKMIRLPEGTYLIQIRNGVMVESRKVVVISD